MNPSRWLRPVGDPQRALTALEALARPPQCASDPKARNGGREAVLTLTVIDSAATNTITGRDHRFPARKQACVLALPSPSICTPHLAPVGQRVATLQTADWLLGCGYAVRLQCQQK